MNLCRARVHLTRRTNAKPIDRRVQPVPAPTRKQPSGLVPVEYGSPRTGSQRRQANPPQRGVLLMPLVPRHGAGVVREPAHRRLDERTLHLDQSRPRGAPGHRLHLHGGRPGDDWPRRMADDGVPYAGRQALLWGNVLSAGRPWGTSRLSTPVDCAVRCVQRSARGSDVRHEPALGARAADDAERSEPVRADG